MEKKDVYLQHKIKFTTMNRLLRLKFLVLTTLCCVICLSVSAQNNSNMVRTYKMAYYDVDDDCYKRYEIR